ncbi:MULTISPECIES: hypothetical protein [Olivibacter]|uniref:Uncharacterized protein n=1 Tax=Olivibacter jilunii TaxID=985016 RepID=A0ABW6AVY1_9SPHI
MMRKLQDRTPEIKAVDALLNRGVSFDLRLPAPFRWFKKTLSLTLTHTYYGISLRISKRFIKCGINPKKLQGITIADVLNLYANHGVSLSKIVALSIINNVFLLWLVTPLAWLLRSFLKDSEMAMLLATIMSFTANEDFVNIICSTAGMLVTTPPEK